MHPVVGGGKKKEEIFEAVSGKKEMASVIRGLRERRGRLGPRRSMSAWRDGVATPLLQRPHATVATVRMRSEYALRAMPVFAMQFGTTRACAHLLAVCDEEGGGTILDSRALEDEGARAIAASRQTGICQTPFIGVEA